MKISNIIYLDGTLTYPTTDGRSIQFILDEDQDVFEYDFELSFHYRDTLEDLPTDVIEHRIWVPDTNGKLWTTATRFTSAVFVRYLYDLARAYAPYYLSQMDENAQKLFEDNLILEDIHYSDDDRIYRQLVLADEVVTVKFHYTVMTFDVAVSENQFLKSRGIPTSITLAVRLREDSLYDTNGNSLPDIKFEIEPEVFFLHNTALFNEKEEYWTDSQLPIPLVFEPTNEQSQLCQSNVIVTG